VETTPTAERLRLWKVAEDNPEGPLCPACGGGDLVRTIVGRGAGPMSEMWYCAGVWDAARRRQVRRSCGWVGTPG
jgi:hypothetical protein